MKLKKIALCVASPTLLLLAAFATPQDPTPQDPAPKSAALERKVRKLMDLTGAGDMGKQAMDQMLDAFATMPQLPDGFLAKFKATVNADDLVELVVPIYKKHLDEATLDAAIAFAETPAGKTFYAAQPQIMQESMAAGQAWGQEAAAKVLKELGR